MVKGAFQCQKCGNIIHLDQNINNNYIRTPIECYESEGGCGRVSIFQLISTLSRYKDFQKLLITNPYYESHRKELEVHCYENHCKKVLPGEMITINGVYYINQQDKQLTQETYFLTRGFESAHSKSLEMNEEEKKQADELSRSPDLWSRLLNSFAPSIHGHTIFKEVLLLQQTGGSWYDLPDGTTKRGSIHVILVGDPGTVKSTAMQASCRIAPIFTKASGRGATIAGITAGATKDPLGEGWILQAGALVRANGGICYLDEFDKLPKEVQGCLHGPMEQGVVEQSKIGSINQILSSRTAILASMNPKYGRFDNFRGKYIDQIDLDPALLNRFDLIIVVEDLPNEETDKKIVYHIHKNLSKDSENVEFSSDFLRKYINHAKLIRPIISDEMNHKIVNWFIENRLRQDYHVNFRHYEAIRRLSEASAKIRLSESVIEDDIKRAIRLFQHSLDSLGIEDLDSISTGLAKKERMILQEIEGFLPAYWNDILHHGYNEDMIQSLISKNYLYEKDGRVFVKRSGYDFS